MKIQTNYKHEISGPEVLDYDNSVTAKNQYVSLGQMVARVSRGEQLDCSDHSNDNPLDSKDTFDVLDMYMRENPKYEELEKERIQKLKDEEDAAKRQKIIDEYEAQKKASTEA